VLTLTDGASTIDYLVMQSGSTFNSEINTTDDYGQLTVGANSVALGAGIATLAVTLGAAPEAEFEYVSRKTPCLCFVVVAFSLANKKRTT
jgi:hypothetical protein